MTTVEHRSGYESAAAVHHYGSDHALQPPEETILGILGGELAGCRFLDLGMGAGRTTGAIAPRVKEYVGIDYAQAMVEACQARFSHLRNARFQWGDARKLTTVADGTFDVALFSFNGIDSVGHEDRRIILREMIRAIRPGGHLWFSAHNKLHLSHLFSLTWPERLRHLPGQVRRFARMHLHNFPAQKLFEGDHALVYDGLFEFGVPLYYVDPRAQVRDLRTLGLTDVRAFALADGHEIPPTDHALGAQRDPWVYFLARRP